jgi:D-lactate dehydrogenase (cytochrome)
MYLTELTAALRQFLGADAVLDTPELCAPYRHDWIPGDYPLPDLVVLPTHPDQIPTIVQLAQRAGVPIVARGAGTGLAGGARPLQGGLVIATTWLTAIEAVDLPNRQARVQPGLITYDLSAALAPQGWFYAPDPASWQMCTIGGNIANNSGGPRCLKYGVTTNHVLAVGVTLHDGRSFWTGDGISVYAWGGYDLTGLIVGSEGTFGIVNRALVRLTRAPEANRVALALFRDVVAACAAVSAILAAGHLPTALEVMDATTMLAVNRAQQAGLPEEAGAALIIEVDGVNDGLDAAIGEIAAICQAQGSLQLRTATSAEEQARLWAARRSAFASFHTIAPSYYLVDTVVPRTRLPAMMAHVQRLSAEYALPIANVFHAGDGNLHPLVLYDPANPEHVAKAHAITAEILTLSIAEGGAVSGEHGIGVEKQDFLAQLYGPAELAAQAALYALFNPQNRLNPGKIFPAGVDPLALAAARAEALAHEPLPYVPALLRRELADLLGADAVLYGAAAAAYAVQGMSPDCVALPGSLEALAAAMATCQRNGATVVPWGGGTQQALGALAEAPHVVISTQRLKGVLHYDPNDLTIGVAAGTTLAELQTLLAEHNQQFPLDVAAAEQTTLGGLVATAAIGARSLGYGTLRDLVLGLTIVQADGTILRLGGQVVKNVSGYDLLKLFIGSQGTLGIIAEVRLRTFPCAPATTSLLAGFTSVLGLHAFLADLAATSFRPTAVAYVDASVLAQAGVAGICGVAVRFEGSAVACTRQVQASMTLATQQQAHALLIEDAAAGALWAQIVAQTAFPTESTTWQLRSAVLPADFCAAVQDLSAAATAHDLALTLGGQPLHGLIVAHLTGRMAQVVALHQHLLRRWPHTQIAAGSLPAEHEALRWGAPASMPVRELNAQIKHTFDPHDQLNRGRYLRGVSTPMLDLR